MRTVQFRHECPLCHYETHEVLSVSDDSYNKRYIFKKEVQGRKPFYRISGVGCIRCPRCGVVSAIEDVETEEEYKE